jgi:hypothetical protein
LTHPNIPIYKIYGPTLQTVKVAFLSTGNGVGFEIFEFIDPPHVRDPVACTSNIDTNTNTSPTAQEIPSTQKQTEGIGSSTLQKQNDHRNEHEHRHTEEKQEEKDELKFDYNRAGFFHIAITAPDVDAAISHAISHGAKQIGETVNVGVEGKQRAAYVSDPWGNVVEVVSCSFERLMANTT